MPLSQPPLRDVLEAVTTLCDDGLIVLGASGQLLFCSETAGIIARRSCCCSSAQLDSDNAREAKNGEQNWLLRLIAELPPMARQVQPGKTWRGEALLRNGDEPVALKLAAYSPSISSSSEAAVLILLRDSSEQRIQEMELRRRNSELEQAYTTLAGARRQLLQSEKLASIGQLAAGVAHEINNPIGYVHSNLGSLQGYARNLITLLDTYDRIMREVGDSGALSEIDDLRQRLDVDFVARDLPQLVTESLEGIERVRKIVQDLKDFSYTGPGESWTLADLHRGLDSTLNIVWNELKYKVNLVKQYGVLPPIECLPSELNQVFLNILINAGQSIEEHGTITITTAATDDEVSVSIADTGVGMSESQLSRIFDPFYTTKPVGQGTGLGLSISYGIVQKHNGRIDATSTMGTGTEFRIVLPIRQPAKLGKL